MKTFEFEKQGIKFVFRNPKLNQYGTLVMEYKIPGIKENKNNDGYFYNSSFLPHKNAMKLSGVKINGKEVAGVGLPEDVLTEIKTLYEQYKKEDLQKRLNSDIRYTMNDTTAYGIYNGISQFDIEIIVRDIKKQLNSDILLFAEEIAKILNKDEELKQIAVNTYQPDPENENWNEEYLTWFRSAAKEKEAPGYGIIPNHIIKSKITEIILNKTAEENKTKEEEQNRINNIFETAKKTGEKQLISKWLEDCNDPREECNTDICCEWAMPDGTRQYTRNHTW
jgi:hypothetical protein